MIKLLKINLFLLLIFFLPFNHFAQIGVRKWRDHLPYRKSVDLVEVEQRGKRFGQLSAIYVLGNGLGQILSGFLIELYPWFIPFIIVSTSAFDIILI